MTLDSIGDGVIATDTYGRVTFINHVAESLTGWTSADAVGAPLAEVFQIVHEGTGELVENPVDRVLREKVQVSAAYHVELVARDGARKPIEDKAAPIWDDQGTFVGVVLIFRDSSQRRRTEQRQAAQLAVTSILAESGGFDHAAPRLLGAIGENTGWDVGLLWGVDPTGDRMSCHAGWYAPAVTVTEPAIASAGMTIARGEFARPRPGDGPSGLDGRAGQRRRLRVGFRPPPISNCTPRLLSRFRTPGGSLP